MLKFDTVKEIEFLNISGLTLIEGTEERIATLEILEGNIDDINIIVKGSKLVIESKYKEDNIFQHNGNNIFIGGNFSGLNINVNGSNISINGSKTSNVKLKICVNRDIFKKISNKGSMDLEINNLIEQIIDSKGTGDILLSKVPRLDINSSGTGDIDINDVRELSIKSTGTGDVFIEGSRIDILEAFLTGTGDLTVDSDINSLRLKMSGTGDAKFRKTVSDKSITNTGIGRIRSV